MNIKTEQLRNNLLGKGTVAVSLSGGLDSSVLLACAVSVLGADRCLAVTIDAPYMMRSELSEAAALCRTLGVRHATLPFPVPEEIRDNPPLRCYLCKRNLFGGVKEYVLSEGIRHILDGTNLDDDNDYRPGRKALRELGIESPFKEAGMGKVDIRMLGRELGLAPSLVDKPACACLLTRLEHGTRITEKDLQRIDRAEQYLRSRGITACRVRVHGTIARIETPAEYWPLLTGFDDGPDIASHLGQMGFDHVTLDLHGYRQGSMNKETP